MDTQTAKKLYKASIDVKMLGFKDVFVTGILGKKIFFGNNLIFFGENLIFFC